MNKVIYFTNAVDQEYFKEYLKLWKVSPNLSNQNFHNKVIKALSVNFNVEVISIRPINRSFDSKKLEKQQKTIGNITYKYSRVSANKIAKYLCLNKWVSEVLDNDKEATVFVDTLNLSLLKSALRVRKKYGYKVFGVCTDNPNNISFTSEHYKKQLLSLGQSLDGYVVLTDAINKIYNVNNKPFIKIDGVSEDISVKKQELVQGDYIYFGGSLMREYGVYNLVAAFKELKLKDIKLVLCGHHLVKSLFDEIKDNESIVYLGPVSYEDNLSLEKEAILSVNPRPINPNIDDYSIPSKTLECLSVGSLNITVRNKLLEENYKDCIIWAESSEVKDLKDAINKALSLDKKERDKIIKLGKEKVMERTSIEVIGKLLHDLVI